MRKVLLLFIIGLLLYGCSGNGSSDGRSSPTSASGSLSGNLVGSWKTDYSDIVFAFGPDGSYQETQYISRDLTAYTLGTYGRWTLCSDSLDAVVPQR